MSDNSSVKLNQCSNELVQRSENLKICNQAFPNFYLWPVTLGYSVGDVMSCPPAVSPLYFPSFITMFLSRFSDVRKNENTHPLSSLGCPALCFPQLAVVASARMGRVGWGCFPPQKGPSALLLFLIQIQLVSVSSSSKVIQMATAAHNYLTLTLPQR